MTVNADNLGAAALCAAAPINFRIFMAHDGGGPQSEFWTPFVKSTEIV